MPIVILGTDAVLAALPATPVQLAHACLRAGFANVIPASWGDEIVATAVLRRLGPFGDGPAIQCSCPFVAHRLLAVGADLRPLLLPVVPPPVAIARYVRALSPSTPTRITYVGACPGAVDESIDIRMTPEALISMLAERQIELQAQPRVFESIIPPDRRRYRSMPGGVPTAEALWAEQRSRSLVEVSGEDFVAEISQMVLSRENVLIDPSVALGCACSGAVGADASIEGRHRVMSLEPPRAAVPVVPEDKTRIELDLPVPVASRTPVDVVAVSTHSTKPPAIDLPQPQSEPTRGAMPFGHRVSPIGGLSSLHDALTPPAKAPATQKPITGPTPVARADGRSLPRAYVARRRQSPRGTPTASLPVPESPASDSPTGSWRASRLRDHPLTTPAPAPRTTPRDAERVVPSAPTSEPTSEPPRATFSPADSPPPPESTASDAARDTLRETPSVSSPDEKREPYRNTSLGEQELERNAVRAFARDAQDEPRRDAQTENANQARREPLRLERPAASSRYDAEPSSYQGPPPATIQSMYSPPQSELNWRLIAIAALVIGVTVGVLVGHSMSKSVSARPPADTVAGSPY